MIKFETNNYSRGINTKEFLIIHHTGNTHLQGNLNVLSGRTNIKASVHYLVDHHGEVYKWEDENKIFWHCGVSNWLGRNNLNRYSIGIEVLGPGFTKIQKEAVAELIIDITKRNKIKKENILRHKDIAPGRKTDIADSFWNDNFDSWGSYINSLFIKKEIMGFYETIFKMENPKGSSIFNDLDGALNRCIKKDGRLDAKEFFYLVMIGLERIKK